MKIKKIKSEGQYVYPATIAAAVKDANILDSSGKPMSQGEINAQQEEINKKQEILASEVILPDYADLSYKTALGEDLSLQNTANCYIIYKKGKYKFPLVYGNGIINGEINSNSYTKDFNSKFKADFVNAYGNQITSPYIENDTGKKCASAQFTIGDAPIFKNLGISKGYLYFKVTSIPLTGANGILSVKDSDGQIMWNWHIWVQSVWAGSLGPRTIFNSNGERYDVLGDYLGTTYDLDSTCTKTWFYQWGRSTPLIGPNACKSTEEAKYYGKLKPIISQNNGGNYEQGITNPTTFFSYADNDSAHNWYGNSVQHINLWNTTPYENCTKSIYDPSPVGFKVAHQYVFTGLSLSDISEWPITGIRDSKTGEIGSWEYGVCWTNAWSTVKPNAYTLMYRNGAIYSQMESYPATGCAVCCIVDTSVNLYIKERPISKLQRQNEKIQNYVYKQLLIDTHPAIVRKCIPMGAQVGMNYLFDDGYIRFKIPKWDFMTGLSITVNPNYIYSVFGSINNTIGESITEINTTTISNWPADSLIIYIPYEFNGICRVTIVDKGEPYSKSFNDVFFKENYDYAGRLVLSSKKYEICPASIATVSSIQKRSSGQYPKSGSYYGQEKITSIIAGYDIRYWSQQKWRRYGDGKKGSSYRLRRFSIGRYQNVCNNNKKFINRVYIRQGKQTIYIPYVMHISKNIMFLRRI